MAQIKRFQMIHHIINRLKNDSTLTDLCPASNIYPLIRMQGSTLPAISIQIMNLEPKDTKSQTSNLDRITFHVTAFHDNPREAWAITERIRFLLDGWSDDGAVQESRIRDLASDVFESTEVFSFTQEFEIFMT